jgi:hypothetical protein
LVSMTACFATMSHFIGYYCSPFIVACRGRAAETKSNHLG